MTTQYVHAVPLSAKQFSEDDLFISKKYILDDVYLYPSLYDKSSKDFRYIDRRILDISKIEVNPPESVFKDLDTKNVNNLYSQVVFARAAGRGEDADRVDASIGDSGYELCHVPIAVAITPNGVVTIVDGRTRLNRLVQAGFTNVIVDFYECTEWKAYLKELLKRNRPSSPRSPMTKSDIIVNCNTAVKMGWLNNDDVNEVRAYVEEITDKRIAKNVMDKILQSIKYGDGYSADVKAIDEKSASEFLKVNGYKNNENNNGIYYTTFSASAWSKAVVYAAKELHELESSGANVKELRVVLHTGTLDAADPSMSWQNKIDSFRSGWKEDMNAIEISYFKDARHRAIIRLFAAIPAVSGLGYPMDKLVMFHVGELKDQYFRDIRLNKGLINVFDVADE